MISHFNYTLKMNDSYINSNYDRLPGSYLFSTIAHKIKEYQGAHANADIIRLGIGDVTTPLIPEVIKAMHSAVDEMGVKDTFRGYGPEQGYDFLREAIVRGEYTSRGIEMDPNDIFVSDGSKCDVANIQELFSGEARIAIPDPVYPVYLDSNVMAGRTGTLQADGHFSEVTYLASTAENNFQPDLPKNPVQLIYLCSPNNPTGTVLSRETLQKFVDYANKNGALILFDGAYNGRTLRLHGNPARTLQTAFHVEPSTVHQVQRRELHNATRRRGHLQPRRLVTDKRSHRRLHAHRKAYPRRTLRCRLHGVRR